LLSIFLHTIARDVMIGYFMKRRGENLRKVLEKICVFLERKLYGEPTYEELSKELDKTKYYLDQAVSYIDYVRGIKR